MLHLRRKKKAKADSEFKHASGHQSLEQLLHEHEPEPQNQDIPRGRAARLHADEPGWRPHF